MHALLSHEQLLSALMRTPQAEKAAEGLARDRIAARRKLIEQLAALETHQAAEWPRLTAKIEAAAAGIKSAERVLVEARVAYQAAARDRSQLSLGAETRRAEIERELRAGEHPAIAEFRLEMDKLRDEARKALDVVSESKINGITGQIETFSANNSESIYARIAGSLAAQDAADKLALEADQGAIPAALDELRQTIPAIEPPKLKGQ